MSANLKAPSFPAAQKAGRPDQREAAPNWADALFDRAVAPAAKPAEQEEDYTYTYLPQALHPYLMKWQKELSKQPWWLYWLLLGLQGAAVMALGSRAFQSDLPYLIGIAKKRRDM